MLSMIAEARLALVVSRITKLTMISSGSIVLRKVGMSFNRVPFMLGMHSTTVSKYPFVKSAESACL